MKTSNIYGLYEKSQLPNILKCVLEPVQKMCYWQMKLNQNPKSTALICAKNLYHINSWLCYVIVFNKTERQPLFHSSCSCMSKSVAPRGIDYQQVFIFCKSVIYTEILLNMIPDYTNIDKCFVCRYTQLWTFWLPAEFFLTCWWFCFF